MYANINEINLKSSEMLLFCEYRINNRHIYFLFLSQDEK